ncbi:hypothetical protein D3C86_895050 [compost metagenome]
MLPSVCPICIMRLPPEALARAVTPGMPASLGRKAVAIASLERWRSARSTRRILRVPVLLALTPQPPPPISDWRLRASGTSRRTMASIFWKAVSRASRGVPSAISTRTRTSPSSELGMYSEPIMGKRKRLATLTAAMVAATRLPRERAQSRLFA